MRLINNKLKVAGELNWCLNTLKEQAACICSKTGSRSFNVVAILFSSVFLSAIERSSNVESSPPTKVKIIEWIPREKGGGVTP